MELNRFLHQLKKRWLLLIALPLLSMLITFVLVRNMPATYSAQAMLATGLVDETQHSLSIEGITFQESKVNQQFTNVVEMMKLKKTINKVSFLLMVHDLSSSQPFRKPSKEVNAMTDADKRQSIGFFHAKYEQDQDLNLFDNTENRQFRLLKSMKYDADAINSQLNVYRKSNSDYIEVEFSSENPNLSPFVVNTLCTEFIKSYDSVVQKNKGKTSDYLAELLRRKYAAMNEKIALLKDYKIQNKILNLYEQSKILYTNIVLIDSRKQDAQKEIEAYNGAIKNIDSKFNPADRKYLEGTLTRLNRDILATKNKLQGFSDLYLKSEYNDGYKKSMDSLQKVLNSQINALTDQYIYDPLSSKKDLMGQKLNLEIQRDIAQNSLNGLGKELNEFNSRFNRLVPFEAVVQSYERDIDIASRQYLDILNKYNQLNIDGDNSAKFTQVQVAMPGPGAPTKKILFVLVSGIITFVLCVLVLFVQFFFDKAIGTPAALAQQTDKPVLGSVATVDGTSLNLGALWQENNRPDFNAQKALLRSIRFEVMRELGLKKVLCVTSLKSGEGTSFVAMNLAYAFGAMRKRVLLIDGNFGHPTITQLIPPAVKVARLFQANLSWNQDWVTVAGNDGENLSPFEIAGEAQIKTVFDQLPFDLIIIDAASFADENKAHEWCVCADKIIAVFDHNRMFGEEDRQQTEWLKQTGKFAGWVFNNYSAAKA